MPYIWSNKRAHFYNIIMEDESNINLNTKISEKFKVIESFSAIFDHANFQDFKYHLINQ